MYPSKKVLGVPAAVLGHVPGVIYGLYQVIEDGHRRTLQEEPHQQWQRSFGAGTVVR